MRWAMPRLGLLSAVGLSLFGYGLAGSGSGFVLCIVFDYLLAGRGLAGL